MIRSIVDEKSSIKRFFPYLIIIAFILISHFRNFMFWSQSRTFIFADTAVYSSYIAGMTKHFPSLFTYKNNYLFWNPYFLSVGIPTLSLVDFGFLYPPNILIGFVSWLSGNVLNVFPLYSLFLYVHLFFGSVFIYKILKEHFDLPEFYSLIGSLLWTFIGYNTEFMSTGTIFLTAAYLPVCFYMRLNILKTERKLYYFLFFSILALSFLAGYPVVSMLIYLVNFFYTFFVKNKDFKTLKKFLVKEFVGLFLITIPIISPLYFSSSLNFPYSIRSIPLQLHGLLENSADILNLTESFLPKNTSLNTNGKTYIVHLYFSLVGLIIFIQQKNKFSFMKNKLLAILFWMGVFGLLLSIGKWGFLSIVFYYLLPGFGMFRRISIFSLIPSFAFCIIVPCILKDNDKSESLNGISMIGLTILLFSFLFNVLFAVFKSSLENYDYSFLLGLSEVAIVSVFVCTFLLLHEKYQNLKKVLIFTALLIEATFNVSSKHYLNSKIDPKLVFTPGELVTKVVSELKPMERVDLLGTQYNYETGSKEIEQTAGYVSLASIYGVRINEVLTNSDYRDTNLREILGVRYTLKKTAPDDINEIYRVAQNIKAPEFYRFNYIDLAWESEASDTFYSIYKSVDILPRLYLASEIKKAPQDKDVLSKISLEKTSRSVFIDQKISTPNKYTDNGYVNILDYKNNYIKAAVDSETDSFLANSTGYYPGWWARINGKWTRPIQTNWFMMGVFIPAGKSVVEFYYFPYGFIAGVTYIIVTVIFWIFIFAFKNKLPLRNFYR